MTGPVRLGGLLEIRNPVILAAGVLGDSPEMLRAAYEAGAGAVVTKSLTVEPRPARPEPTVIPAESGGWLNAVGLANPGAEAFARRLGCTDGPGPDYPVIVSLAGSNPEDIGWMVELFGGCVAGYEINLSCPNVDGMGQDVGDDPKLAGQIVGAAVDAAVIGAAVRPVFAKIGHHMVGAARAARNAGAAGLTAINTVPATAIDLTTGEPVFDPGVGGLSGPPIKTVALRAVHDLATARICPIMGCGGISTWQDAAEFLMAGAAAVQVGSAAMNDLGVLGRIADGLAEWGQ